MFPGNKETDRRFRILFMLAILIHLIHGAFESNVTKVDNNSSCVQAEPPINASAKNASCIFYSYKFKDGFCKGIINSLYVFGNNATLEYGEKETATFQSYFGIFNIDDDTRTTDCYYGIGVGYRGNVSVTRSGRTCQPWTSQCPHRHWRMPEGASNGHNMCRNPEGSAPDGPWCYTIDPKVRWEYCNISQCPPREKPQPPRNLKATNVQTRYFILTWDKPKYGSYYPIDNYTLERKKATLDNFTVVRTLPFAWTGMMMKDLEPATEYIIRLSSNNKYGRSDGVLVKQSTLPDRFIRNLVLIIVLPLSLAVLFIVVICLTSRLTCKPKTEPEYDQTALWMRGDWREFPRSNIKLQEKLGEGAFGEVYNGLVQTDGEVIPCAVKKLKANATVMENRDLINELKIMVTVGEHPNIVSLIGACTRGEPILVLVRLAENGCLLNQLKKSRENPYINVENKTEHFTNIDKIRIARDVAKGMSHLSSKVVNVFNYWTIP